MDRQIALIYEELERLCVGHGEAFFKSLRCVVDDIIEDSVSHFYDTLDRNPDARLFIKDQQTRARLTKSLAGWLRTIAELGTSAGRLGFLNLQLKAGEVHARLGVSSHLVLSGFRILRQHLNKRLSSANRPLTKTEKEALIFVNEVLDISMALMNGRYVLNSMRNEREDQGLRDALTGHELAIECERARAALFGWASRVAEWRGGVVGVKLEPVRRSEFGRWLLFKAELLLGSGGHVQELLRDLSRLEHALGALTDASLEGGWTAFRSCVEQMAVRLEMLSMVLETEENARDPLTRLLNRRYLDAILRRETLLCQQHDSKYVVAMIDLDHFKKVNDQFGHTAGDALLSQLGTLLHQSIRSSDFLFRYGGEEFLAVFGATECVSIFATLEQLRERVAQMELPWSRETLDITVSIGVAEFDGNPDPLEVVKRADRALYEAKEGGRNRVICWQE